MKEPKPIRLPSDAQSLINIVVDLQAQRNTLLEWIVDNGDHSLECYRKQQVMRFDNPSRCYCGLRQILGQYRQPMKDR